MSWQQECTAPAMSGSAHCDLINSAMPATNGAYRVGNRNSEELIVIEQFELQTKVGWQFF